MRLMNDLAGMQDNRATNRSMREHSVGHSMRLHKVEQQHAHRRLHAAAKHLWPQLYPTGASAAEENAPYQEHLHHWHDTADVR